MRFLALLLLISACERDESLTAYGAAGTWDLQEINGQPFDAPASIVFAEDGQVKGEAPCNSYSTYQSAPYPWIELGPILSTKRACADLSAEQDYFAALGKMSLAEVSGELLILSNDEDESLLFRKQHDG
ncbi:META domain-containing protein [Cognatishimia activa]|uniref:META domain-containing protein n=1 Tax=Cognatishimia activa TaxID=1715691 RepID=UPI0022309D2B|nr:META domain-containing protein [Cognatishimia activa]UZD90446.1 META domain-containing protein [Cognatishimia activa]